LRMMSQNVSPGWPCVIMAKLKCGAVAAELVAGLNSPATASAAPAAMPQTVFLLSLGV
jgi:hypothetical protein